MQAVSVTSLVCLPQRGAGRTRGWRGFACWPQARRSLFRL